MKVLRTIKWPCTERSIRKLFTANSENDLQSDTGVEADKHRRRDLFTKMTAEEYNKSLNALIELDTDFAFLSLKHLTQDNSNGVMAIANQLGMHVCRWLRPSSMQEAKNSLVNSRCSIRAVLSAFSVIADDPTYMATAPATSVDDAGVAVPTIIPRATLTHFEDALCELATKYRVDFTAKTCGGKPVLSVTSLAKEKIPEYRRRFVDTAGWRALMELVVTYFGADRLQHDTLNGFVLGRIVGTFL